MTNVSKGFSGWEFESLKFTATDADELLGFLALGTPLGLPPTFSSVMFLSKQ
jgi:hypothetical protein